jgi:hypothetical protein
MEKTTIKKGKLTEKKLVELYGSEAQKKSYKENGRFIGNYKKTLLTKMSRYCTIEDLGDRTYKITNVYDYPAVAITEIFPPIVFITSSCCLLKFIILLSFL